MKAGSWFKKFGKGMTLGETLDQVRADHGSKASSWLSDKLGVSQRTAQRYLAGTQKPSLKTRMRMPNVERQYRRKVAGEKISRVRSVNVGRVEVISLSAGVADGKRRIGNVNLPASVMEEIGELYAEGRDEEAEEMFNDAVMAVYGGEDAHDRNGLASVLRVKSYNWHMTYTT